VAQNGLERLVLTLPSDPSLARLTRLVTQHFFRHNGLRAAQARRQGAIVEARCLRLLRSTGRGDAGRPLVLVLIARPGSLEVTGRDARGGPARRILRIGRPVRV